MTVETTSQSSPTRGQAPSRFASRWFFLRWLPTFLGFPIGGWIAVQAVDGVDGPLSALLAGVLAGVIIGTAQWLALRSLGIGMKWVIATTFGMAVGSAIATAVTDAATTIPAQTLVGFITGASVGVSQWALLDRNGRSAAFWTVVVSVAWGLGRLVTANVIVDAERGYVTFGASGALVATVLTGLALQPILRSRSSSASASTVGT